jgi:hypothetical protein
MSDVQLRQRLGHLYALLTGMAGLFVLAWLFAHPIASVDLPALLAFTLIALVASYFRVPIACTGEELGLDGAVLLGATLAGGPVLGGWAAFVTGLVRGFVPIPVHPVSTRRWQDSVSAALLNGGRDVIALVAAWWAYQGLGGRTVPASLGITQTLAVIILCFTYALVRCLWTWPFLALQRAIPRQQRSPLITPASFLLELAPLPIAVLTAVTFVYLGWSFFLLLALVFIGMGAAMRGMHEHNNALQDKIAALQKTGRIKEAIAATPPDVGALCALAHQLCQEVVSAPKFELGLCDSTYTSINIQVSVTDDVRLPPMRIPLTPQWEWLCECRESQLVRDETQIEQLPFALPPIGPDRVPRSAIFVPIVASPGIEPGESAQAPPEEVIGGIVLQSPAPGTFSTHDMEHVAEIARRVGTAIETARQAEMS